MQLLSVDPKVRLKYQVTSDLRKLKSSGRLTMGAATSCLINYQNRLKDLGVQININNIRILQNIFDESENNQVELRSSSEDQPDRSTHQQTFFFPNQQHNSNVNIFEPQISLEVGDQFLDNGFTQESQKSECIQNNAIQNFSHEENLSNAKSYSVQLRNMGDQVSSRSDNINKESTHWGMSGDEMQSIIDDFIEDEEFIHSQVKYCRSI